jgi:hypothetical protein
MRSPIRPNWWDHTAARIVVNGDGSCRFAQAIGQLTAPVAYEQIVATQFQHVWTAPSRS